MTNPSNSQTLKVTDDTRISMSVPRMMLEVPPIEGYVMHWFADRPGRINRAMQAGYEFVNRDEVQLNNMGLASDMTVDGNTDLGTRISIHGGVTDNGSSERMYLMKIKKEWYNKDMDLREQSADRIVQTLKTGSIGADHARDPAQRYAKGVENLFTRKKKPVPPG